MSRIAILEPNRLLCELLSSSLARQDYQVDCLESLDEAPKRLSAITPDLLIVDTDTLGVDSDRAIVQLRKSGVSCPIYVVSENARDDAFVDRMATLGISNLFPKPFTDLGALFQAIRADLYTVPAESMVENLESLRLEFITDLSHQLRTPLTAMKLAMDGLFSQLDGMMTQPQRGLADISRRNIDRIVTLVENQLDMLQMVMGDAKVSRRFVDLDELVSSLPVRVFREETYRDSVLVTPSDAYRSKGRPVFAFTDPDLLRTLIGCVLFAGPPRAERSLNVEWGRFQTSCQITISVNLGNTGKSGEAPDVNVHDFERRAYRAMLTQIGGDMRMIKSPEEKRVEITLPVEPRFDRNKDFLNPVRTLRKATQLNQQALSFVRCEFETDEQGRGLHGETLERFVGECRGFLTLGDSLVRGRHPGAFYVALVDRSEHELEHIRSHLSRVGEVVVDNELFVSRPHTIIPDDREINQIVRHLEIV